MKRYRLICQSPSDRNLTISVHEHLAWAAARGIARDTHHAVVLIGQYGTARFDRLGGGKVEWNEASTWPGVVSEFNPSTTVCI